MRLRLLFLFFILVISHKSIANNIYVGDFNELILSGSQSINGDTVTIINNLISDESIGNSFYTKNITFQGENHSIDGKDIFGGFVLSEGSEFNNLKIINCKGQNYNNSYFAGAIYNTGGDTIISNSAFSGNYANALGSNFAVAGALYNMNGGVINIDSSLFNNNYAYGASAEGGAIGNESGANSINISNSVFSDNYTNGRSVSYGGAIYNSNNATMNIVNSLFNNNSAITDDRGVYLYGGGIYNTGNMNIENSYFLNNHIIGNNDSFSYGGAIHNNSNLNILNSIFKGNYIASDIDSSGGAIYNYVDGNLTIQNSIFIENSLNAQNTRGGAIGNEGVLTIINSTFKDNTDLSGLNDIFSVNTINFNGDGTTNIYGGIRGSGEIYKNDNGVLNLGGNNSNYTGNFSLNAGTVNILADCIYFNAKMTNFSNDVNFNMQNNQINNINFGLLTLNGESNVYPDVDFSINKMDTISADSLNGSGTIFVPKLSLIGVPKEEYIAIPFADSVLKNSVKYNNRVIETPIYDYLSTYNSSNGYFSFTREGFNSSVFAPAVATQLAGYLSQVDMFNNVFSNLDMVNIIDRKRKIALNFNNKVADFAQNQFIYSPVSIPEQNKGIWLKPFTIFEKVPLRNGPDISNVSYGNIFGGESGLLDLKKGWKYLYGGYGGYSGSHQAFDGVSIYNNGGFIGALSAFYKNNFFSLWSISVGANCAKSYTNFGNDNFSMLSAGVAQKTGFNISLFEDKFVIQPNILTSYTFVNAFDYVASQGVSMDSKPLNALHIEPQIKVIGNFKNLLQPYMAFSVAWNVMDESKFYANDVYLPELSVKPYVRYGAGIQKRIGDSFLGFIQAYITNGGRNGIGLQIGLRWSIGREKETKKIIKQAKMPEFKKPEIILNNIRFSNI